MLLTILIILAVIYVVVDLIKKEQCPKKARPELLSQMQGRAILITGCDSGFGHALASHCRTQLSMVVIACCHNKNGREGSDALEQRDGCHVIRGFDVADPASVERARTRVDAILEEEGLPGLYCVVNNAAVLVFGEAEWQTSAQIAMQMQVLLFYLYLSVLGID